MRDLIGREVFRYRSARSEATPLAAPRLMGSGDQFASAPDQEGSK